ncbi:MAG: PKD domain-containing protein [Bacteroidetes bacterium]|nr:MAG: PKD domain-containing protein [Bacteroidota bacterium]
MRTLNILSLLLPAMLSTAGLEAQQTVPLQLQAPVENATPAFRNDRASWQEDVSQRKANSSTYRTTDGRIIMHYSSRPVNYKDASGQWQHIEISPKATIQGWIAESQPNPVYLRTDASCLLTIDEYHVFGFSRNVTINGVAAKSTVPKQEETVLTFSDILPGIDKVCEFRYDAIKYNYVLHNAYTAGNDLLIEEEYELPYGFKASVHAGEYNGKDEVWLQDAQGAIRSKFHTPVCFDANKKTIAGEYELKKINGKHKLILRVPAAWLNDPQRVYPVVIDPLVTGPLTTWTGGAMPSCFLPAYNVDSIQVWKPAQVTLTGFYVTGSYYADPFTPAQMHNGRMFFSTTCSQGPVLTVAPPTGNTAGTAYLQDFDYRPQLTCCWPNSCSAQQFWLRMHIARDSFSTGCNTTYVRYDPSTTSWPFEAYMEGRTVESGGVGWNVLGSPVCSDDCSLTGTVYIRYGVPPYTITHPWMIGSMTIGTNIQPCFTGITNQQLSLTNPNCPQYCGSNPQLSIPPPTVYDACNLPVTTYVSDTVNIISVPLITASPDPSEICTGMIQPVNLSTCLPSDPITWTGSNSTNGTGNLQVADTNSGTTPLVITYIATSSVSGCPVPADTFTVTINPNPAADFTYPTPVIAGQPMQFADASTVYVGTATIFNWEFGDGSPTISGNDSMPVHTFGAPGVYTVCFGIITDDGCSDRICEDITVIPAEIVPPNVFTPNGDGVNDMLTFTYLEYFPDNTLRIFNRWGNMIYEKSSYQNDWNAKDISDGTYYYLLELPDKKYSSVLTIIR